MRGGLWVLCAEVQKSQNASPVLKVLPPPRGGGGGGGGELTVEIATNCGKHNPRQLHYSNNLSKKRAKSSIAESNITNEMSAHKEERSDSVWSFLFCFTFCFFRATIIKKTTHTVSPC